MPWRPLEFNVHQRIHTKEFTGVVTLWTPAEDGSFDAQGKGEGRADRPQPSGVAEDGEGGFSNDGTLRGVVCHSPFSWRWNPLFFDGDGYFDFGRFLRTSLQNNVFVCLWMIIGDLVIFGCMVLPQGETEDSFPCGETQTL